MEKNTRSTMSNPTFMLIWVVFLKSQLILCGIALWQTETTFQLANIALALSIFSVITAINVWFKMQLFGPILEKFQKMKRQEQFNPSENPQSKEAAKLVQQRFIISLVLAELATISGFILSIMENAGGPVIVGTVIALFFQLQMASTLPTLNSIKQEPREGGLPAQG